MVATYSTYYNYSMMFVHEIAPDKRTELQQYNSSESGIFWVIPRK